MDGADLFKGNITTEDTESTEESSYRARRLPIDLISVSSVVSKAFFTTETTEDTEKCLARCPKSAANQDILLGALGG